MIRPPPHIRIGNHLSLQDQLLSPCGKSQNDRAEKMALKRMLNDLGLKIGVSFTNMNRSLVLNPFDLTLLMNAPSLAKLTGEFAFNNRCCATIFCDIKMVITSHTQQVGT